MTVDEVRKLPSYKLLTTKEMEFIDEYAESEDIEKAVKKAFGLEGVTVVKKIHKLQRHPQIGHLLAAIDGVYIPNAKETLHELWKVMQTSNNESTRLKAAELIAKIQGWIGRGESAVEDEPDEKFLESLDASTKQIPATTAG